jgi:transcriptional regulator with XRE-family HTH domain
MKLKARLREYLKEKDMTAAQLARKTGISSSVISDWLAGASPKNIEQVKRVAEVFGVCVDILCFGKEDVKCTQCRCSRDNKALINDELIEEGLFELTLRRVKKKTED